MVYLPALKLQPRNLEVQKIGHVNFLFGYLFLSNTFPIGHLKFKKKFYPAAKSYLGGKHLQT